ncbi:MAG: EscU/YscU/HrcU family type III secretion system export apparatus switch protein [Gaiellales bacterium]
MSASEQPRRATAVRYDGSTSAPSVIASGRGHVADAILEAARASGIPVREDAVLAQALASLEIGTEIPPELYEAVAQSLVWAYRLTGRVAPAAP